MKIYASSKEQLEKVLKTLARLKIKPESLEITISKKPVTRPSCSCHNHKGGK